MDDQTLGTMGSLVNRGKPLENHLGIVGNNSGFPRGTVGNHANPSSADGKSSENR